ncbi:MAG: presenilin family intramembrane aspartyl protease [Candidatus Micrarchaeia archaeon]
MQMKTYLQVALFFALTQVIGIYAGVVLIQGAMANPDIQSLSVAPMPTANDPLNAVFFLAYILFGAVMVILAARYYKGMIMFQLLEAMVIFSASSIVFFAFALFPLGMGLVEALAFGGALGAALAAAKFVWAEAKNAAAIISSAGVGAIFGFSLGFLPAVIFTILLSIYDYIAVFKTRHMVEMARELSTRQLSFAVTAKDVPERKQNEKIEVYVERANREGDRLDLGTGDLSVPAMVAVSAYTLGPNGLVYSFAVATGSTIALYALLKFVSKERVFLPALPPICLGGMLGLLLVKLAGF